MSAVDERDECGGCAPAQRIREVDAFGKLAAHHAKQQRTPRLRPATGLWESKHYKDEARAHTHTHTHTPRLQTVTSHTVSENSLEKKRKAHATAHSCILTHTDTHRNIQTHKHKQTYTSTSTRALTLTRTRTHTRTRANGIKPWRCDINTATQASTQPAHTFTKLHIPHVWVFQWRRDRR